MKIYLILKGNVISGYSFDKLPETIEVEVSDPETIVVGVDTYEGGEIVHNEKPASQVKRERIIELKQLLAESDYLCLKHADGELTDEEYASIKAQRHAWRQEINSLEE